MCLHNLKIEDTRLSKRTVHSLAHWMKTKNFMVSIGINKVKFDEPTDFKHLMDSLAASAGLKKITI